MTRFDPAGVAALSDKEIAHAVAMVTTWQHFSTLVLKPFESKLLADAPAVWMRYGSFTWKQRKCLQEILVKVGLQMVRGQGVHQARQSMNQQVGTDGRLWNVDAQGKRWRHSDSLDSELLQGCYIEDDMRTPAQCARDARKERFLDQRGVGFGIGPCDDNSDYREACDEFDRMDPP